MSDPSLVTRLTTRLASLEGALALLLLLGLAAIPGTFLSDRHSYYGSWPFILLLAALSVSLLLCTLRRWRQLRTSVLIVHLGILLTLAGFLVREFGGTVATINLYEGDTAGRFYLPYRDRDVDLGFTLQVRQVHADYYPVPLRIGVLAEGRKQGLHQLRTGEAFTVGEYRIVAERLDAPRRLAQLAVYRGDQLLGQTDTAETTAALPGIPYQFRLVAYQDPKLRRTWADLRVDRPGEAPVTGRSEVNAPLDAGDYSFYYVSKAADAQGRVFVGIQLVRDPGRWYVFAGMTVAAIGALLAAGRRWYGAR